LLVDLNHPIYNILDSVWKSHTEEYGYELTFIEYYEIKEYKEGDEFGGHIDTHGAPNLIEERKLNLTVQLSDPKSYEGGDLYIKNHRATKSIGSGIFFPPDVVHRVTKVTSGTRYCLIGHGWGVLNRK
jgi:PKHD-type hydroxylase